jgi:hypothetical protein
MASFPEVTHGLSQTGRPDDGNDTTGFFDTEYFVDLKPKEQSRRCGPQNCHPICLGDVSYGASRVSPIMEGCSDQCTLIA